MYMVLNHFDKKKENNTQKKNNRNLHLNFPLAWPLRVNVSIYLSCPSEFLSVIRIWSATH